jgi:hypothetical protein
MILDGPLGIAAMLSSFSHNGNHNSFKIHRFPDHPSAIPSLKMNITLIYDNIAADIQICITTTLHRYVLFPALSLYVFV